MKRPTEASAGSVMISRALWDDPAFKRQPLTEREAFIWLIMEARWRGGERRIGHEVIELERGQLAASVRFIADAWGWPKSTVSRYLDRLVSRGMINRDSSGTATGVLTLCNYDKYQGPRDSREPKAGQKRDSGGTKENKGNKGIIGGGGGSACAIEREAPDPDPIPDLPPPPPPAPAEVSTFREQILEAMSVHPSGLTGPNGRILGTLADMEEARLWTGMGLTEAECIAVVAEAMAGKRDGPPRSFKYFLPAMKRLAAAKQAPPPDLAQEHAHARPDARTAEPFARHAGPGARRGHGAILEGFARAAADLDD